MTLTLVIKTTQFTYVTVSYIAGKKMFSCETCPMVFTRREAQHIHMKKHKKVNPFKCQICMKTFWLRKERDKHKIEEHASEMSLGCPKCDRKFFDTKSLRIHLFQMHDIKITATIVNNKRLDHSKKTKVGQPREAEENDTDDI